MLVLKLSRVGKKHQPSYRLIVSEKRSKLNGKYIDYLGWYNPYNKQYQFNKEKALRWINRGAQKTDTVHNLLVEAGIVTGKKIAVDKKNKVDQTQSSKKMENQMNPNAQEQATPVNPEAPETTETPVEMPTEAPKESVDEPATMPEAPVESEESVNQ